ncbi:MAG: TetR/AcrR family transcriptional regulator [Candidatus Phaeomarinobacter sp.]
MVTNDLTQPSRTRDRDATRKRFIAAAGRVLARDGFAKLGVNTIAAEAKADKVLIYRYFGGLQGLMEAYAADGDFWPSADELLEGIATNLSGAEAAAQMFRNYRIALADRPLTLEILAWETIERNEITAILESQRSNASAELINRLADRSPAHEGLEIGATLIAAALSYLIVRSRTIARYSGLDLRSDEAWNRIDLEIQRLLTAAYD